MPWKLTLSEVGTTLLVFLWIALNAEQTGYPVAAVVIVGLGVVLTYHLLRRWWNQS